jgi:hypothetical protein
MAPKPFPRSPLVYAALALVATTAACEPSSPPDEIRSVATVREIMADMIGPSADVLWSAIETVSTPDGGYEDKVPESDEEWARLRHGATTMVESANLLLTQGRRIAHDGDTASAPGVELEPDSIASLVISDRARWVELAHELQDKGQVFLDVIDAKSSDPLLDAGDGLNTACEDCHEVFWYPTQ